MEPASAGSGRTMTPDRMVSPLYRACVCEGGGVTIYTIIIMNSRINFDTFSLAAQMCVCVCVCEYINHLKGFSKPKI